MNENTFSGSWGIVILIAIFFLLFGGNGLGNGSRVGESYATQADIQRAVDLDTLKSGQSGIIGAIKDSSYNTLGELRDIQSGVAAGFYSLKDCCCETNRNIDSVRFDMANYANAINTTSTANTQKVLDALAKDKIDSLQNQINALQLRDAMCGVVRYPMTTAYNAGMSPFCGNYACGNI